MNTVIGDKTKELNLKYTSPFLKSSAWIYEKSQQLALFDNKLAFYPKESAILFKHPDISMADDETQRKLLIHHLLNHLEFTIWLEMGPISQVCQLLRYPDFLPWLPYQMKDDALMIYIDEARQVEMSIVLINAIEIETGLQPLKLKPAFLSILDHMLSQETTEFHSLIKLFFVIIAETLIVPTLTKVPKNEMIQQPVRDFLVNHVRDEVRHSAYFRQVFKYVWPSITREMQYKIGRLLPSMILAFFDPDEVALNKSLQMFPGQFPFPYKIVSELIKNQSVQQDMFRLASSTINMLRENGVFKDVSTVEAFQQAGFLEL